MVSLILFDLDGVLIKAKEIHFIALNKAIGNYSPEHVITIEEHLKTFDGLKTYKKLEILSTNYGLDINLHEKIWKLKQEITVSMLDSVNKDENLIHLFENLSKSFKIGCCSNSISKSIYIMLSKLGIIKYFDFIISNEDVENPKPHPEIYWKGISKAKVFPNNVLIIEDSPNGLLAAYKSGANVLRVNNPEEVTFELIIKEINRINKRDTIMPKWKDDKMNVLIPMAGKGERFIKAGYTFPKPLIEVNGKPMIQLVVENLNIDAHFIFIVLKEHYDKYNLKTLLNIITNNNCTIIQTEDVTEGAACTTLLAENYINDNPLLISNCDQFLDWNSNEFLYKMQETNVDCGITTFESIHPKWSFAKLNDSGYVIEVAEKNPISNIATTGIYYYKSGLDYVKYAKQMIEEDIRVNGEFYVCPVFNQFIKDNKKIIIHPIKKMWGLGIPEDLEYFIRSYDNNIT